MIWKREALLLLMYVNIAVIIRFVLFPRELVDGNIQPLVIDTETAFGYRVNFIPFIHLSDVGTVRHIFWNVAGNAALFIPTGIILPIVYKQLDSCRKVLAAGATISLIIEIIQLPVAFRATDIDDIILNTLGVLIGYGIYLAVKHIKR